MVAWRNGIYHPVLNSNYLTRVLHSFVGYRVEHLKRNSISPNAMYYSLFLTTTDGEVNKNGKETLCDAYLNQHASV